MDEHAPLDFGHFRRSGQEAAPARAPERVRRGRNLVSGVRASRVQQEREIQGAEIPVQARRVPLVLPGARAEVQSPMGLLQAPVRRADRRKPAVGKGSVEAEERRRAPRLAAPRRIGSARNPGRQGHVVESKLRDDGTAALARGTQGSQDTRRGPFLGQVQDQRAVQFACEIPASGPERGRPVGGRTAQRSQVGLGTDQKQFELP